MNMQEAIKTGRPLRRKDWVNKEFRDFHEWTIDELDILAQDWEVEPEKNETKLCFTYPDHPLNEMTVELDGKDVGFTVQDGADYGYHTLSEQNVDKLLTFLYNNTKIGKSRVIPF